MIKLKKANFEAGSPYSMWLKEEIIGEIGDYMNGRENRGLVKKYNVDVFEGMDNIILSDVKKFDDYPEPIQMAAGECKKISVN